MKFQCGSTWDEQTWDYEDRMVSATVNSVTSTYTYRGDGLRNSRTVGMTTTQFTWDIAAGLPVVLDDGNQYLYGAGLSAMKQSGNWFYYLADGLGSTMAVVDSDGDVMNGYTYDVYGEPTVTGSLANEFDFAGQQTDPTGLQYLRARYYDPGTGVFLSREPLATVPTWLGNPLGYGGANPGRFADPTGLVPVDDGSPGSCGSSWCIFEFLSDPSVANASYQWVEYQGRSEDLFWRTCWIIGEYTRCGDEASDTSILANINPDYILDAVDIFLSVHGFRPKQWTLDDGSTFEIPKQYKYKGPTANGRGYLFEDAAGNTIRVMKPNALNPHGYIRIQNAKGKYLDAAGHEVGDRDAAGHIQLGGSQFGR